MCGIIGFRGTNVTMEHLMVLQKVMIESRIRGMHASGIAWCDNGNILSVVKPEPIDQLVKELDWSIFLQMKEVSLIAHARYSTSDIKYNQPIVGDTMAIAHNGVITQSSPDIWKSAYGYACKTKNDSELLLRCLEAGDNPLKVFPDSSYAGVAINKQGELNFFRNSLRPLWAGKIGENDVIASTYDILNRAGVQAIHKLECVDGNHKDLQRRDNYICRQPIKLK